MAILPVKRGLSSPAVVSIPSKWDDQWFRMFIDNFLTNADIRNVTAGSGITVSGNVSGNSTSGTPSNTVIISQAAIANNTVLGNISGATAIPVGLTQTQLTTLINVFTATLSGAVPFSGGGTVNFLRADGTWQVPAGSAAIPNDTVLGNISGGTAAAVALTQTQLTSLINAFTATLSGAVPASGGGTATWLRADGTFTTVPLTAIGNDTVLGNVSGGSATPVALTQTQLTTLINVFTSTLSGAVPASGGGTTNFLRADGTFATPPGSSTGANPTALVGLLPVNGTATTFLRSDGAPELDVSIAPTWSGNHTFQPTVGIGLVAIGATGNRALSLSVSLPTFSATGNAAISIANTSATAQTPIDFFTNTSTLTGRIRNDSGGDMSYVSFLTGNHAMYVGGDAGVGILSFQVLSGKVNLAGHTTTTTAPAAGGAGALPATPKGYVTIQINGSNQQIAYY